MTYNTETYNTEIIIKFIDKFFENKKENSNVQNEEHTNNLNIKGQWGSGKTTYIKKLEKDLDKIKYQVKIFNVWEYEISDNIFVSVLCDILNLVYDIKTENEDTKKSLKEALKNLAIVAGHGLTYALDFWIPSVGAMIRGCLNKKSELDKKTEEQIISEKSGEDPLFKLIQTNQYYQLLNDTIEIIKNLIGEKKYIIIFDELDRCTIPKMIEFLSIIKNILFKLNNCFFIVSCDSDKINKMLSQNENNKNENYTNKIFYVSINIKVLSKIDKNIINNNNELIENYIYNLDDYENEYRTLKKAIERKDSVIKIIESTFNINKNKELFEFITFWIYYKKINLQKCLINLNKNNLKYVINEFVAKTPEYKNGLRLELFNNFINGDDNNNLLRIFKNNFQSLPFPLFIPFIKNIYEFKIKEIITSDYFKEYQVLKIMNNNFNYKSYWIKYENIISYISDDFKKLINIIFEWYENTKIYIELDINIKEYFEYMQNII